MNITKEDIEKGLRVVEYLYDQYGKEHTEFIWSRISTALRTYSESELKSMGDKIALFNGWNTLENLKRKDY